MKKLFGCLFILACAGSARADLHPPTIRLSSTLQAGATFFVSSGTVVSFNASSATITHIIGTVTNDSGTVGSYGEYVSSAAPVLAPVPTNGQFGDAAAIVLTAGDWDVSANMAFKLNGATITLIFMGIGTTSGNVDPSCLGDCSAEGFPPTAATNSSLAVPAYRISIASQTTVYLKVLSNYSVATPQIQGRISARRVR